MKRDMLPTLLNFVGSDFIVYIKRSRQKSWLSKLFLSPSYIESNIKESEINEFSNLQIFKDFNKLYACHVDDYIKGIYSSIPIIMTDIYLSSENILFDGLIIKIPVNKNFLSSLYVTKQGIPLDILCSSNLNLEYCSQNRVHLEDPVFEKYFDVYADDQVEARYILTTGFMNRLVSIAAKNKKCSVSCSFIDGYMYLALDGKDWFDIPSSKSFSDIGNWQRVLVDFIDVFRIIDELKVEQNIGM